MEVVICKTKEEASRLAADMITALVKKNPKCVLGLATGSTPVEMYKALAADVKAKKVSFKNVKSWNLDEYWGLPGTHDQSYRYFMDKNLFDQIDINKKNTHVLNGLAKDWKKEVTAYEAAIKKAADVPKYALSMGVGTILEAKTVVLLAFGANKADAIKGAVEGGISQFCTASALQMHPDAWFFCDEAAAAKLKLKKYYAWRGREELARRG